jgi:hypothetical protein
MSRRRKTDEAKTEMIAASTLTQIMPIISRRAQQSACTMLAQCDDALPMEVVLDWQRSAGRVEALR